MLHAYSSNGHLKAKKSKQGIAYAAMFFKINQLEAESIHDTSVKPPKQPKK